MLEIEIERYTSEASLQTFPNPDNERLGERVRGLILGRLALIFLLLLASWWWSNTYRESSLEYFPFSVFIFFLASFVLTLLYLLAYRFSKMYALQVRVQLLIDVLFVSYLIHASADFNSPYVTLYFIVVGTAGYFLNRRETLLFSILCAATFGLVSAISPHSPLNSLGDDILPSKFVRVIAFNTVGILVVGLLAGHLSDRRRVTIQLKQTEEDFDDLNVLHERILESIRSGLITTDLSGRIRAINRAAEEIMGIAAEQTIGTSVYLLFGGNIRPSVDLCLYRASEGSTFPTEHFETETRAGSQANGNSSKSMVAGSVAPLLGKTGMVNGLILTFQDVTEIRAMEHDLRQSDRLAAVGRMAAGLAHEIRNPLGSMSSALQFLDENIKHETPEANLMDVVLRESERLNEIISNFLTYARLSAGGLPSEKFEPVDLGKAIDDCLVLLKHSPEVDENQVFEVEMPETSVTVNANAAQIKQVFWNLLRNSIQAMPDGGKLTIRINDVPTKAVTIEVIDTGVGISSERIENLFEPFSSYSNGAGLGLSIVHKIVRDHGGNINIDSRENFGTTIRVELPH